MTQMTQRKQACHKHKEIMISHSARNKTNLPRQAGEHYGVSQLLNNDCCLILTITLIPFVILSSLEK